MNESSSLVPTVFAILIIVIIIVLIVNSYILKKGKEIEKENILNSILIPLNTSSIKIEDWSFINPSIAKINTNMYIVLYRIHKKRNLLFWRSKIGYSLINIGEDVRIIKEGRFEDMPGDSFFACGYEDPRVFIHNGKIYALAVLVENMRPVQYLLELNIKEEKIVKHVRILPDFESAVIAQKNWVPIHVGKNIVFSTRVEPHVIVKINFNTGEAKKLYSISNNRLTDIKTDKVKIHGGASPIEFHTEKSNFLGICHLKRGGTYTSMFYKFNNKFEITEISQEFTLPLPRNVKSNRIQMITGLEWLDQDNVIITAGLMDTDMQGYIVSIQEINRLF